MIHRYIFVIYTYTTGGNAVLARGLFAAEASGSTSPGLLSCRKKYASSESIST
jgi:hypothetical protein